eukprot:TRINITY_DN3671_c1_g1_i1.p1 TRINITY_DN3671_c1_g1~~TRINITY_DN3671_c1_g1_i1.p1  ORF type:complete len:108 (+),score=17.29 TRINITY_DN3671_c1_g1_i1:300-623(+)
MSTPSNSSTNYNEGSGGSSSSNKKRGLSQVDLTTSSLSQKGRDLTDQTELDFSPALSQLICTADFLNYLNICELFPLTLISREISMLTCDHISKKYTFDFSNNKLRF